jgi:hypothetical protein
MNPDRKSDSWTKEVQIQNTKIKINSEVFCQYIATCTCFFTWQCLASYWLQHPDSSRVSSCSDNLTIYPNLPPARYIHTGYISYVGVRLSNVVNIFLLISKSKLCYDRSADLIWVTCYIKSEWTDRENIFPSRIQGNVCLSLSDGLFPRIFHHGNIFHFRIHENVCWSPVHSIHGNAAP